MSAPPTTTAPSGWASVERLVYRRAAILVPILLGLGLALLGWQANRTSERIAVASARASAEQISTALTELRTAYTAEVVAKARAHGMQVRHDYAGNEDAIPLPATLTMLLGERMNAHEQTTTRLYSATPSRGGPTAAGSWASSTRSSTCRRSTPRS